MKLREEISELFPTEDKNIFYLPHSTGPGNECRSARGCLYNYYEIVRKHLRTAGILSENVEKNSKICEESVVGKKKQLVPLVFNI